MASASTQVEAFGQVATGTVGESCSLQGTTAADCHATVFVAIDGTSTSTASETLITGTDYHRFDVAITGGADKTGSGAGTCSSGAMATVDARGIVAMAIVGVLSLAGILVL